MADSWVLAPALAVLIGTCHAGAPAGPTQFAPYGRLDLNLTTFSRPSRVEMSQASTSRFGLRGSEELGGGRRTIFRLESSINANDGSAGDRFWDRESWIGLQGRWGTLRLGRSLTPSQRLASDHDPHETDGIGSPGSTRLLLEQASLVRVDNALHYATPLWSGLSVSVAKQIEVDPGMPGEPRITSTRLRYRYSAIDLSAAYGHAGADKRVSSVGASVDLGVLTPMLQAHWGEHSGGKYRSVLAGFVAGTGAWQWRAAWSRTSERDRLGTSRVLWAAGVDHLTSLRTNLYATVARDARTGERRRHGLEVGIRHSF